MYEKRVAAEKKLEQASKAADADHFQLEGERKKVQRELKEQFELHTAETLLKEFAP